MAPSINDLTNHFNILDLNLKEKITIFDDVVNSIFYPNSIYASNKYHIYENFDHQYFYANNDHGKRLRIEKVTLEKKVFDWDKFLKVNSIKNVIYDLKGLITYQKKAKKEFSLENFFN